MILEAVMSLIKLVIVGIFNLLPSMGGVEIPTGFFEWFTGIISMVAYFLPLTDFFVMMGISFAITNFEIIWKTVSKLWKMLPFV